MDEQALRGRDGDLNTARGVLRRAARTGQGAVVVVSGEGGVGKTAFLREVCRFAVHAGFDVGVGRAEESDQVTPMAAVLLALRSGPSPLLSAEAFRELAPIQDQRLWMVDRLVDELEARAVRRPITVCVDDAQWADPASVFALEVLPGRLLASPIVWLVATRPGSSRVESLAANLSRGTTVSRVALGPLDSAAIEQLAVDRLGAAIDGDVRGLLLGAGGMPFLAVALLDGLATRVPVDSRSGARSRPAEGPVLPTALVVGVRARLEALPSGSRRLVRVGSVLGRTFDLVDAGALLDDAPEAARLAWLEAAVRAGVLEEAGGQVVFRHDLVRQAVYEDMPVAVGQALHRQAAEHLLAGGRGVVAASSHVLRSAAVGDLRAVDILRAAAVATAGTAPAASAELAARAFALLPATEPTWGEVGLEALSRLNAAGGGNEAMDLSRTLLAAALDVELDARIRIEVAHSMWRRGELSELRDLVDNAGALPAGTSAGTRAHLLALSALARCHDDDAASADRSAHEALVEAERSQDAAAETTALHALGESARNDGRNDEALRFFRRMRRVSGVEYFHDEVLSLQMLDRFDESAAMLTEAEARADAAGRTSYPPDVSFGLMWQAFTRGRLDDTEIHALALLRVGDELKQYSFHSEARVLLSRVAELRGDLPAARDHLRQARDLAGADTSGDLMLAVAQAWLSHTEGDLDGALAAVRELMGTGRSLRHRWLWQPGWLLPAVLIAAQGGDHDLAAHVASLTRTLHHHNASVPTNAALAVAAVAVTTGDTAGLREALTICRTSPRLMVRAMVAGLLGQALLRDSDRDGGVAALDEAWDLYTQLGAHGEARRVQRLLQAAGVRRRNWTVTAARPVHGWEALTGSEQRVARLIADGHTNRSAAQALFLSPNTIATHLRAVYSKLQVRSRVQLSLALAALDAH